MSNPFKIDDIVELVGSDGDSETLASVVGRGARFTPRYATHLIVKRHDDPGAPPIPWPRTRVRRVMRGTEVRTRTTPAAYAV